MIVKRTVYSYNKKTKNYRVIEGEWREIKLPKAIDEVIVLIKRQRDNDGRRCVVIYKKLMDIYDGIEHLTLVMDEDRWQGTDWFADGCIRLHLQLLYHEEDPSLVLE